MDEGAQHSAGVRSLVHCNTVQEIAALCIMFCSIYNKLQGASDDAGVLRAQRSCPVLCFTLGRKLHEVQACLACL